MLGFGHVFLQWMMEKWSAPQKLDRLVNLNIELGIAPGLILLNQV